MESAGVGSKNNLLHPKILMKQLDMERLAGFENLEISNDKPILHQAVLAKLHGLPKESLTLSKLLRIGFDVNALDDNGQSALLQVFLTTERKAPVAEIIDSFVQPGAQTFDVDPLMENLGKHLTVFGQLDLGPLILLQLAKHANFYNVPASERTAFGNFRTFC